MNLTYLPTSYYDAGQEVIVGGYNYASIYINAIDSCQKRTVTPIGLLVGLEWLGSGNVKIDVAMARDVSVNDYPTTPAAPTGDNKLILDSVYSFTAMGSDPDSDGVYYFWDWGDGNTSGWLGPYSNDSACVASHSWDSAGDYNVRVYCRDPFWYESDWSESLPVTVACCQNRGNVDGIVGTGGAIDVSDLTYLVAYLFQQGPLPPCDEEGNVDGIVGTTPIDVSDLTFLVAYLFQSGATPPPCN